VNRSCCARISAIPTRSSLTKRFSRQPGAAPAGRATGQMLRKLAEAQT
jgi:hypothetical protein